MAAPRRDRRAARRRLHANTVYTLKATGKALEVLAECLILRPDGKLVATKFLVNPDKPESTELMPYFVQMDKTGGWRAKLAYRLLGL